MKRLLAFARSDAPLALVPFLAVALLLRLPAVCFARGYEFLDQQFQYVDPAWHVATGASWYRSWDWVEGIRSMVYPGALAGVFRAGRALGVPEPEPLLAFARFGQALFALLPMAALWLVVTRWRPQVGQRQILLWVASWFLVVYPSVQTNAPFAAAGLSVASVLFFLGPGRLWPFVAGVCLGLAFCGRVQDAVLGPALFVTGLLQRRPGASVMLTLGCLPGVLGQGFLDLHLHGTFLHSAWRYFELQYLEGVASRWPTSPPWAYATMVAVLFLLVFPSAWRWFKCGARALPVPLAMGLTYLAAHSLIERKQFRFAIPAFVLLAIVYVAGMVGEARARRAAGVVDDRLTVLHRRSWLAAHAVLLMLASVWYFHRGPVEAAKALAAQADFAGELVIVGGDETSVGGYYYLQRPQARVHALPRREDLAERLRDPALPTPLHVVANGAPLAPTDAPGWRLVEWRRTTDPLDVKKRNRRYLYRAIRDG